MMRLIPMNDICEADKAEPPDIIGVQSAIACSSVIQFLLVVKDVLLVRVLRGRRQTHCRGLCRVYVLDVLGDSGGGSLVGDVSDNFHLFGT